MFGMATSKVEMHFGNFLPLLFVPKSFMQKSAEWSEPGARSNHNYGRLKAIWESKSGFTDEDGDGGALWMGGQKVCANSPDQSISNCVAKNNGL
jgi:hypothetical protein